jgi:hypothetical protein
MKHTNTTVAAWSLLVLFTLPLLGAFGWMQLEKYRIKRKVKHEIIAQLHADDLVKLSFHTNEINTVLRWEHDREFEYQHTMYDIVYKTIEGDTVHYWCWEDKEESELNQQLKTVANQCFNTNPSTQKKQLSLQHFLKSLFANQPLETMFANIADSGKPNSHYKVQILSQSYPPSTPPPCFLV